MFAGLFDRDFGKITNDGVNIATDIAHFGKLGGFNFNKGRICKLGESPRNFSFSDTRWSDHQNIFWMNFSAQRFSDLLTAPTIAQRDGNRALGPILTDDVLIEFRDNFTGGHG